VKLSKRLTALLLALALALTFALPALAEGESEEPNPAMPVITVQPQTVRVKANRDFTLSVKAHIPNGDEIGYWWWDDTYSRSPIGSTEKIKLNRNPFTYSIYVEVYNAAHPEYSVTSEIACVEVYRPAIEDSLINFEFLLMLFAPLLGYPIAFLINYLILPLLRIF
jgi:hypothetical protein